MTSSTRIIAVSWLVLDFATAVLPDEPFRARLSSMPIAARMTWSRRYDEIAISDDLGIVYIRSIRRNALRSTAGAARLMTWWAPADVHHWSSFILFCEIVIFSVEQLIGRLVSVQKLGQIARMVDVIMYFYAVRKWWAIWRCFLPFWDGVTVPQRVSSKELCHYDNYDMLTASHHGEFLQGLAWRYICGFYADKYDPIAWCWYFHYID